MSAALPHHIAEPIRQVKTVVPQNVGPPIQTPAPCILSPRARSHPYAMPRIPSPPTQAKAEQRMRGAQPLPMGGELATIETEPAKSAPKPRRMRPPLRKALELIAIHGHSQRDAASMAGMHETALSKALAKPHVAALLHDLKAQAALEVETLRKLAKGLAVREGIRLMRESGSDQVRARLVEFFAAEPKTGPSVSVSVPVHLGGYAYPDRLLAGRATDGASVEGQSQTIEDAEVVAEGCDEGPSQPPVGEP